MKIFSFIFAGLFLLAVTSPAASDLAAVEKCYQRKPFVKTKKTDSGEEHEFHNQADVQVACTAEALELAKKNPSDGVLAMKLANLAGKNQNWAAALPIFKVAVNADKKNCTDANLKYALVAGLQHPSDDPSVELSQSIWFDTCWSSLKSYLLEASEKEGASGYFFTNTCKKQNEVKPLSGLKAKKCK